MPRKPKTPCQEPGCGELLDRPGKCRTHDNADAAQFRAGKIHTGRWRPSAWKGIRAEVLREEPACRSCGGPSAEVDHAVALHRGGTNERSNLQALCRSCHRAKTNAENAEARRRAQLA